VNVICDQPRNWRKVAVPRPNRFVGVAITTGALKQDLYFGRGRVSRVQRFRAIRWRVVTMNRYELHATTNCHYDQHDALCPGIHLLQKF
jgi:hypothetical protein